MPARNLLPLALFGAALTIAAPASAQSWPAQPPEIAEQIAADWDQARANWLTECTWNQSRGNRSRSEAREYCEAYFANHASYPAGYQQAISDVPAVSDEDGSSYAQPADGARRPVQARRRVFRPGQERMELVWRKRCEAMLGQGDSSPQSRPNPR